MIHWRARCCHSQSRRRMTPSRPSIARRAALSAGESSGDDTVDLRPLRRTALPQRSSVFPAGCIRPSFPRHRLRRVDPHRLQAVVGICPRTACAIQSRYRAPSWHQELALRSPLRHKPDRRTLRSPRRLAGAKRFGAHHDRAGWGSSNVRVTPVATLAISSGQDCPMMCSSG